jgi:antitoxin (DNA-binding transcriptional repressor) of toxin-antitoxin stability system
MTRVGIAELKDRLSEHLRAVENGAEVIVLDRKRPIARIVPMVAATGRARIVPPTRDFMEIRDRRRTRGRWPIASTELLLEERREG